MYPPVLRKRKNVRIPEMIRACERGDIPTSWRAARNWWRSSSAICVRFFSLSPQNRMSFSTSSVYAISVLPDRPFSIARYALKSWISCLLSGKSVI